MTKIDLLRRNARAWLAQDTGSWPRGFWHLPGHVPDQGMVLLMGR